MRKAKIQRQDRSGNHIDIAGQFNQWSVVDIAQYRVLIRIKIYKMNSMKINLMKMKFKIKKKIGRK